MLQVVLAFPAPPGGPVAGPIRCGVPVPSAALVRGLAVRGAQALQWRSLPLRAPRGQVWIELAVLGARGQVQIVLGGAGPSGAVAAGGPEVRGPCFAAACSRQDDTATWSWVWRDGTVDRRRRRTFASPQAVGDEWFAVGEALTDDSPGLAERWTVVAQLEKATLAGVPVCAEQRAHGGPLQRLREHLRTAAHRLRELPGRRGAGDFARSGGVVTNLEFDTPLALLRIGLATGDRALLQLARRCAWHLVDRDLDAATGLPFSHGPGHRAAAPQPGHAWLSGLLWIGALCADELLLAAAGQIAHGLAAVPPSSEGVGERARDYAWPLLEMEVYLQFVDDATVTRAADRLAAVIAGRFDAATGTFCFGEGAVAPGVHLERAWVTAGIVLPALRAHLRRRPDPGLARVVGQATEAVVDGLDGARHGADGAGIATHWRVAAGRRYAQHVAVADPKALLLLEGLPSRTRQRLLRRQSLWEWLDAVPALDDPDLPTSWTMVARCQWVYGGW